jgi:MFS transporter, UMF1 family
MEKKSDLESAEEDSSTLQLDDNQLDNKKTILAWSFYDWANSAFATTVMAGFFPIFFSAYWVDTADPVVTTYYLGLANSIASIIVAAMAPFLGAIADKMSGKKKFLSIFAFLGIIMTGGLWLIAQGEWQMAVLFYVLGTIGFSGANIFYDAMLPGVASEKKIDYVSSLGFSLGYIGGGLLFILNVVMYLSPASFGIPDEATAIKLSFLSVGIWWAVFSIPIMLFVKEPKADESMTLGKAVHAGWLQLKETFSDIKSLKYVALFLLGYWFYIDGVDTIIRMAVVYGTSLDFKAESLIIALLLTQFVAFPATILYNKLAKKIGVRNAVLIAIIAYCVITILGYFMTNEIHFYLLACMIGCFQGGIQALSRSLYSRLIPKEKAAQFYGFYNMLGKFAAVIGPLLMALVTVYTGNVRSGILSILILFVLGGILLLQVDFEKGEQMAKEFLSNKEKTSN